MNTTIFDTSSLVGDDIGLWTSTPYPYRTLNGMQACHYALQLRTFDMACVETGVSPLNVPANSPRHAIFVKASTTPTRSHQTQQVEHMIEDDATGLTWHLYDSGHYEAGDGGSLTLSEAYEYCRDQSVGGYTDWRLPTAKELQPLVDYTKVPDVQGSPALIKPFVISQIRNEQAKVDYPYFWTSTTNPQTGEAAYIAFGRALDNVLVDGEYVVYDVAGAGVQRCMPKDGSDDPSRLIRPKNFARCIRTRTELSLVQPIPCGGGPIPSDDDDLPILFRASLSLIHI